jgi:hypothetical protein
VAGKILNFFICLIIFLQLAVAGVSLSPAPAGSSQLFGTYTSACASVDNILITASALGEQFTRAIQPKPSQDTLFVTTEIRRLDEQVFKPLTLPGLSLCHTDCLSLLASTGRNTCGPPGRASPPVMYILIFAIILALSNLPAPVSCFARFGIPGLLFKPGFLFAAKRETQNKMRRLRQDNRIKSG